MAASPFSQADWEGLLDAVKDTLIQDEAKLENNVTYYKSLYESPETDKQQLERIYQKILFERHRLLLLKEVVNRIDNSTLWIIAQNLQTAIQSESTKKDGKIENWSFTIVKDKGVLSTYFSPLPNV